MPVYSNFRTLTKVTKNEHTTLQNNTRPLYTYATKWSNLSSVCAMTLQQINESLLGIRGNEYNLDVIITWRKYIEETMM